MSDRKALEALAVVIGDVDEIALACHVGPDGDALGSMLGFATAAIAAGKSVAASFGSPFTVPASLGFLPVDLLSKPGEFPTAPELMVTFDAGSADRLGELAHNATKARTLAVLDHHVTNAGFGDISIVDGSAAATGELVFELLGILEWEVTPVVADCLHTALMTDTGRFTYENTSPRTLRIAADLIESGARPTLISRHVYEEAPYGYLRAAAVALARSQLDASKGVVSTHIADADLKEAGIEWGDMDSLIDTIRLAEEADVAVLAKVHDDGRVKVSMRSRGATDVGSLASSMGGGGHRLAAGFTTEGEPEAVIRKVIDVIEKYR